MISTALAARFVGRTFFHSFATAISAIGCFGIAAGGASGATPELSPAYSETRLLRSDATLRSVSFHGALGGVAVGDRGAILTTHDGGETWTPRESQVECRLDDVVWLDGDRVVVVGGSYDAITRLSRGVVLTSVDAGLTWRRGEDSELPRLRHVEIREDRTIAVNGDWSHASLATRFISRDGGRTWTGNDDVHDQLIHGNLADVSKMLAWVRATGVPVAVRDACRFGDNSLCVVGDQGVILVSRDEGQSWTIKEGRDRRAAIVMVARDAESAAWSMIGSESLESRHRVTLLLDSPKDNGLDPTSLEIANQVAVNFGGSGADRIFHDPTDNGDPVQTAMQWIAVLRPAVVILDQTLAPETHNAFFQAATASGVQRVAEYSALPSQNTTLHRDALLPKSGLLASDLTHDAMQCVAPNRSQVPSMSVRYLYDANPARRTGESVASGLPLHPGRQLAERGSPASLRQLQVIQARLKQSKRIEELLFDARASSHYPQPAALARSLTLLLDQTAEEDQFRLAWAILAESQTSKTNSIGTQKAILDEISHRFADRSAGLWAKLRLQAIENSAEWERLESIVSTSATTSPNPTTRSVAVSPFQFGDDSSAMSSGVSEASFTDSTSPAQVRQASVVSPVIVPKPEKIDLGKKRTIATTTSVDLAWEFHPAVQVAMDASRRRGEGGLLPIADKQPGNRSANLRRLAESNDHPWSALLRHNGPQAIHASRAASPPRLDGQIDDECWVRCDASTSDSVSLRMAYDDDYIYAAVSCRATMIRRDPGAQRGTASVRDHDLRQVDRMRLCLDVDRDLMTSMQLQATDARRTHDAIDGIPAWQPTWFLDVARDDDVVVFEIAIDRRDIIDSSIDSGNASWFVSAMSVAAGTSPDSQVMPSPSDWIHVIFD